MLRHAGVTADGFRFFNFRTCPTCERTRLEWPTTTNIILLPQDLVTMIQRFRYARPLTEAEVTEYNAAVAAQADPQDGESDPNAGVPPVNQETPPAGQPDGGEGAPEGQGNQPPVPPVTPTTDPPPVPPVATDGQQSAPPSQTPEELAAAQLLASMDIKSKPKKG